VSSSGRRFELRVAALGCIASHAAHRLSSSKMELRSYQWKNPQTQLLVEAPPFLCTGRFCGERVAKKRKGIERRHAIADIKANEGTNGSFESSWCEVCPLARPSGYNSLQELRSFFARSGSLLV